MVPPLRPLSSWTKYAFLKGSTIIYVNFIFPHILDGCVHTQTHMYKVILVRIDVPMRLGWPCAYPHIHVCMKSYVCQFIFSWISDGCMHTWTICMKSSLCEFYIPMRLGQLCAYLDTDVYTIRYVLIYIFMGLGQLCGCPDIYV